MTPSLLVLFLQFHRDGPVFSKESRLYLLEMVRFKDILALKKGGSPAIAFHISKLEMAELSGEAWEALRSTSGSSLPLEIDEELSGWNAEPALQTGALDADMRTQVKALTVNVTQICNLACHYCAAGGDGTYGDPVTKISIQRTLPQLNFFMNRLISGETFSINLLGGEPLLYPDGVKAIAQYCHDEAEKRGLRLQMSLTTNGTLITPEVARMLADNRFHVIVSLDGDAQQTNLVRPAKDRSDTFEKIRNGLSELKPYRSNLSRLSFHAVFGKGNMDLKRTYESFQTLNADSYSFTFDHDERSIPLSEEFTSKMIALSAQVFESGGEKELRKFRYFDEIFDHMDRQKGVRHYCGSGQSFLMIDSKNRVFTCPWDVGKPELQVGEGTDLSERLLEPYLGSLIEKNNCQTCWAKNLCGGGCMYIHKNRTGNKNKPDPIFCERQRSLISQALMYYYQSRSGDQI